MKNSSHPFLKPTEYTYTQNFIKIGKAVLRSFVTNAVTQAFYILDTILSTHLIRRLAKLIHIKSPQTLHNLN